MTGDVVETLRALADNGWGIDDPTRDALLAGAAEVERLRRALVAMGQREAGAIAALTAERDRFREAAQTADSAAEREAIVWADRVVALEAERDRLRARVALLEIQPAGVVDRELLLIAMAGE